jgi:hypothetical protein
MILASRELDIFFVYMMLDRSAEIALCATVVAALAAWGYHSKIVLDEDVQRLRNKDAKITEVEIELVVETEKNVGPSQEELDYSVQLKAIEEKKMNDRNKKAQVLKALHAQLETLTAAKSDGWSAIFAPLPSSETQEKTEKSRREIVDHIKKVEAMTVA